MNSIESKHNVARSYFDNNKNLLDLNNNSNKNHNNSLNLKSNLKFYSFIFKILL